MDLFRVDGWKNLLSGFGKQNRDKTLSNSYAEAEILSDEALSAIYAGDGLGRRIVAIPADDMTRQGVHFTWPDNLPDEEQKERSRELQTVFAQKGVLSSCNQALKWQRLFGGSILVIGAMDGQGLEMPLNRDRVKSVEWFLSIERTEISLGNCKFDTDPQSPRYGKVIEYNVTPIIGGIRDKSYMVHYTRVIPFYGETVPKNLLTVDRDLRYWGIGIIQSVFGDLSNMGIGKTGVGQVLQEFNVKVFTLSNLAQLLSTGQESKVLSRMDIIASTMSMMNAVLLGENEKMTLMSAPVTGMAELVDRLMMFLSSSADIPVSRLFGRSPAGLNSTGEGDEGVYYDTIKSAQTSKLQQPLQYITEIICSSLRFKEVPTVEFNPLFQLTQKEEAEIKKIDADAYSANSQGDERYMMNGVLTADDVIERRGWE